MNASDTLTAMRQVIVSCGPFVVPPVLTIAMTRPIWHDKLRVPLRSLTGLDEGMVMRRTWKTPSICIDEHMHESVADVFRPTFRTIEVAQSNRFKGRDESEFISELLMENTIFVTSDRVFVDAAIADGLRHAGIIFIPENMTANEKVFFAEIVGAFVRGSCRGSPFVFRSRVLYPGHDGLRSIVAGRDSLEISWGDPMVFAE